jgi:hypothetical protein
MISNSTCTFVGLLAERNEDARPSEVGLSAAASRPTMSFKAVIVFGFLLDGYTSPVVMFTSSGICIAILFVEIGSKQTSAKY